MPKIFKKGEIYLFLFLTASLFYIYRDVFLKNRIAFPSNLLVSFYSPWVTQKFEGYPNGIPNKPIGGNDQVRMFYPYRTFINESLARGEFPLWNPYNFSGSPLMADFQSAVFYPLNFIYFILPQMTAWSLLVMVQPFLGTLFMYLYLRQFIKSKLAVFFGAFAFGFSGFILAWSQENAVVGQAAIWLPLILFAVDKYIADLRGKHLFLLVSVLAFSIFAGFLQITFYIFFVAFAYGITRIIEIYDKRRLYLTFLFTVPFFLSFLLSAVQLIPSIEAFGESTRAYSSIQPILNTYLSPLKSYITVLASDIFGNPGAYNYFGQGFYHERIFYIGIIPLVFAMLASFKMRKNRIVNFFVFASLISFIFGFDSFFTRWFYALPIPLISTFTPSRIFYVTSSSLAVLSAFGMSYWLKVGTKRTWKVMYLTIAICATILLSYIGSLYLAEILKNTNPINLSPVSHIKISTRNIILPLFMLFSLVPLTLLGKKLRLAPLFIVLIMCFGQLYFLHKYVVIGNKEFMYPDHFIFEDILSRQGKANRFLSFGLPIVGNLGLTKHVYSPDGIDPVFPKRYGQLVNASKNGGIFTLDIPRIEVNVSDYSDYLNISDNQRRLKIISLLGVNHVYNYEGNYKDLVLLDFIFPKDLFIPLWKRDNWQAYEYKNAFPRAFLVDEYIVEKDPQKSMDIIFDQNTDLRKTVVLEKEPPNFTSPKDNINSDSNVDLEIYKPQKVQLQVVTDKDRILFLSDTYYPGWQATIDSSPAEIYIADYAFRAVVVPKGKHTVTFLFKPISFICGLSITLITLGAFMTILVIRKYKPKE